MSKTQRGPKHPPAESPAPAPAPGQSQTPAPSSQTLRVRTLVTLQDDGRIYLPGTVLERELEWVVINTRLGLVTVIEE